MVAYAAVDDIKQSLVDVPWTTAHDAILAALAERASRLIDALTGRESGAYAATTAAARYYAGSGTSQQWIDELAVWPPEAIEVSYDAGTTYVPVDAALVQPYPTIRLPVQRLDLAPTRYWPAGYRTVRVTGVWGYSTAPPALVVQATITQTVRWFKRGQQAFQDVGAVSEIGQLRYVQALDPDLVTLLYNGGLVRLTI